MAGPARWPGSGLDGLPVRPRRRSGSSGGLRAAFRRARPDLIHSNGLKAHVLRRRWRAPRGSRCSGTCTTSFAHRPVMARLLRRTGRGGAAGSPSRSDAEGCGGCSPRNGDLVGSEPRGHGPLRTGRPRRGRSRPPRRAGARRAGLVRVGLVATYANWKGQDVSLDALARLHAAGSDGTRLCRRRADLCHGRVSVPRGELERRAAANGLAGRVGFIPYQTDPADVYRMLDVAVHASIRPEPFGLTIVEAMSCGKPVVVSAAGGAAAVHPGPRRTRPHTRRRRGAGRRDRPPRRRPAPAGPARVQRPPDRGRAVLARTLRGRSPRSTPLPSETDRLSGESHATIGSQT